jgi:serine/threonine-protein kinase
MSEPVARLNAALEGRYAIERELGEGGMATVYLADDLKHQRKVALKVLKPELAAVVGAERFLAEITTTANLTHPHILPLFDSGEADNFLFYVMPHIEGESLRERIDREKQLGVDDAIAITQKVADALDYAHGKGVVHRDIKPGNILLSERGEPLVADFGIALAVAQAGGGRITETGLSLGTPHYMSPEQATGDRDVDPRSDVYALGCVLYEMLAGQPPFSATTAQAVLVKILTADAPSITSERRTVPPHVGHALAQALEKLPADRFTSAAEFAAALADESFTYKARARTFMADSMPGQVATQAPAMMPGPWNRLTGAFAALAAVTTLGFAWSLLRPEPPAPVTRFVVTPPPGVDVAAGPTGIQGFAVSPNGRMVVFSDGPTGQLFRHELDRLDAVPIPGGERAFYPFFSPDGEWVGYVDQEDETLSKIRLDGSQAQALAPFPGGIRSAGWGPDGTIVLVSSTLNGVWRVRDTGGDLELIPNTEGPQLWWLDVLPNGRAILAGTAEREIAVISLETGERRVLFAGTTPRYVSSGHIVFWRADALWAAPFDSERLEALGPPAPIVEGVPADGNQFAHFDVGGDLLFYQEGLSAAGFGGSGGVGGVGGQQQQQLLVVDLDGNEEALVLAPRPIQSVGWSPDGQSVVYSSEGHIYTYNVALGTTPRQFTFEGSNAYPVFSPDGSRVAFRSEREGTDEQDLFVKNLDDDSPPRSIITLEANQWPTQWPSDTLIVFEQGQGGVRDLWMVDVSDPDSARARAYLSSEADLRRIVVSPDGTLAAYMSNESGENEIYVRSFPDPGERTIVSQGEGWVPFWSPDGNTLYYAGQRGGRTWMAARLQRNPVPVVLSRDSLFTGSYLPPFPGSGLHPDGDRWIVASSVGSADPEGGAQPERLVMVTNFFEELRQRMGN